MISVGFFSEGAVYRLFQIMNGALNRPIHGVFVMGDDDRLAAIATDLDHATFVVVARLVANVIAEMHIDPPDVIDMPLQCVLYLCLYMIGKPLAALDIPVCPDLDQHGRSPFVSSPGWLARYLLRRAWKKPLYVVFCLMFAVWPCSCGWTVRVLWRLA